MAIAIPTPIPGTFEPVKLPLTPAEQRIVRSAIKAEARRTALLRRQWAGYNPDGSRA